MELPKASIRRMSQILGILEYLQSREIERVSSSLLARYLGVESHIIRKDISFLLNKLLEKEDEEYNVIGEPGAGYQIERLKHAIRKALALEKNKKVCVVGLGKIGLAILNYSRFAEKGFDIVAGFEKNINKIETIKTSVSIYPSYMIEEIVRSKSIEIGIIAVPGSEAEDVKESLIRGGIKGILNLSYPAITMDNPGIVIQNIDIVSSLRFIVALLKEYPE